MKLLINTWQAIKNLLMPSKAMPLSDEWLELNEKELRKQYFTDTPKGQLRVMKTIEPEERNTSNLKAVKARREFNTTVKNTLKFKANDRR